MSRDSADTHEHADLASERISYTLGELDEPLPDSPFPLVQRWVDDAFARRDAEGDLAEPTAVVLSTVQLGEDGPRPRSRTVLLKSMDEDGFVIYTNTLSAKGRELEAVPWAAMLLPWYPLQRQLRVEGRVERVADAEADEYWASRPRGSQIGSTASHQSRPIDSRAALEEQVRAAEQEHEGDEAIPRPDHWTGFRLTPDRIEFWQGRPNRVHDRIEYRRAAADGGSAHEGWSRQRLQP